VPSLALGYMDAPNMTRSEKIKGEAPCFGIKWVFIPYYMILMDFSRSFERFSPFLEDLGPFLRPDLGEKLGGGYQL